MYVSMNPFDVTSARGARVQDPGPGVHLWTVAAAFPVSDEDLQRGVYLLSADKLLTFDGPACYKCERPYSARTAGRPCPGSHLPTMLELLASA